MAELKTQRTKASVAAFLNAIEDPGRRRECKTVAAMMKKVTGEKPAMWGDSIIGFGSYQYKARGGPAQWFRLGFSPRKNNLVLYVLPSVEAFPALLEKLGKHKTGRSCLYLDSLGDVDLGVLERLLDEGYGKSENL